MIWGSAMTTYIFWGSAQDPVTVFGETFVALVFGLPYGAAFGATFVNVRKHLPTSSTYVKAIVLSCIGWFLYDVVVLPIALGKLPLFLSLMPDQSDFVSLLGLLATGQLFAYIFNRRSQTNGSITETPVIKRLPMKRPLKVQHQERRKELPDGVRYPIYLGFRLSVAAAFLYVIGATSISNIVQLSFLQTRNLYVVVDRFYSAFFVVSVVGLVYRFAANRWVQGEWRETIETLPYPIEDVTTAVDFMVRKNEWNVQMRNINNNFTEANFKIIIPWELFRYKKVVFVLLKDTGGKATEFYIYSGCACMVDWGQNQNVIINFKAELEMAIKKPNISA